MSGASQSTFGISSVENATFSGEGQDGYNDLCEQAEDSSKSSLGSLISNAASATTSKLSRAGSNLRSLLVRPPKMAINASDEEQTHMESGLTIAVPLKSSAISVRQKLDSAWFSFVYGSWRTPRSKYAPQKPLWLLGQRYFNEQRGDEDERLFREFTIDYYSRIWLTYRTELPPLVGSSKTTDCGWGCTLRTCQMMLAQTLTVLHLGKEWRFWGDAEESRFPNATGHYDIVSLFGDHLDAELGLYRLIKIAAASQQLNVDDEDTSGNSGSSSSSNSNSNKVVGCWYSACRAFSIIRDALALAESPLLKCVRIHCVSDGMLVRSEVANISQQFRIPILIVVYVQLGCHSVSHCYREHLITFLSLGNTVGIIGGKPRRSLYFIGSYNNESLIYLDPHIAHSAISPDQLSKSWQSFHCDDFSKMSLDELDPGCALGFMVLSLNDYEATIKELSLSQVIDVYSEEDGTKRVENPLFVAYDKRPDLMSERRKSLDQRSASHAAQLGFELI